MDADLDALEHKLAQLIALTRELRSSNDVLRRQLAAAHEHNRELAQRMQQATLRLDALLERLPER
jgi:hypothetical protein